MRKAVYVGLAFVGVLAGGGLCGWYFGSPPDRLAFLSVGQGDCTVLTASGTTMMVDVGPKSPEFDAGERVVVPKLRSMGIHGVDLIFLTHPDKDHVGGLAAVHRAFPEARVAVSSQFEGFPPMLERLTEAGVDPVRVIWLPEESHVKVGGYDVLVECPRWAPPEPDNDGSLFIRITNNKNSAVLTGDASSKEEAIEAPLTDWHAGVLKAGHHGSKTACCQAWIDAVHPAYAVVSCGRDNAYGHPAQSVLERLSASRVATLRTDQLGDVVFEPSDSGFRLCNN